MRNLKCTFFIFSLVICVPNGYSQKMTNDVVRSVQIKEKNGKKKVKEVLIINGKKTVTKYEGKEADEFIKRYEKSKKQIN